LPRSAHGTASTSLASIPHEQLLCRAARDTRRQQHSPSKGSTSPQQRLQQLRVFRLQAMGVSAAGNAVVACLGFALTGPTKPTNK